MLTVDHNTLWRQGSFICNDTDLIRTYYRHALSGFFGHVLTTGLGMGIAAAYLRDLPGVESVTVIENDPEIAARFFVPGTRLIVADAWEWEPDRFFDWGFHDIWSVPDEAAAADLEERYAPCVDHQVSLPLTYPDFAKSYVPNPQT